MDQRDPHAVAGRRVRPDVRGIRILPLDQAIGRGAREARLDRELGDHGGERLLRRLTSALASEQRGVGLGASLAATAGATGSSVAGFAGSGRTTGTTRSTAAGGSCAGGSLPVHATTPSQATRSPHRLASRTTE
jgi:hypothetical protein